MQRAPGSSPPTREPMRATGDPLRRKNLRLALILATVALVFFVGFFARALLFSA